MSFSPLTHRVSPLLDQSFRLWPVFFCCSFSRSWPGIEIRGVQSIVITRRFGVDVPRRLVDVLLELLDSLPHRAGDFGDALRTEQKKHDHQNDHDLGEA